MSTNSGAERQLRERIKDPVRPDPQEVTKVSNDHIAADAVTQPTKVEEDRARYGGREE